MEQKLAVVGAWGLGGKVEDAFLSGLALAERLCAESGLSRSSGERGSSTGESAE